MNNNKLSLYNYFVLNGRSLPAGYCNDIRKIAYALKNSGQEFKSWIIGLNKIFEEKLERKSSGCGENSKMPLSEK